MGEVYRATDTNLGRDVAIKVLPEALAQDPERLARFEREARTLASLNHPNIAIVHGLERSQGTIALVMELVDGTTLADRIAIGAVPVADALPIVRQIAEALEAAHEQGIVHRDLKPANVKLRPDGTVKVLDFGLAKAIEASTENARGSAALSGRRSSPRGHPELAGQRGAQTVRSSSSPDDSRRHFSRSRRRAARSRRSRSSTTDKTLMSGPASFRTGSGLCIEPGEVRVKASIWPRSIAGSRGSCFHSKGVRTEGSPTFRGFCSSCVTACSSRNASMKLSSRYRTTNSESLTRYQRVAGRGIHGRSQPTGC